MKQPNATSLLFLMFLSFASFYAVTTVGQVSGGVKGGGNIIRSNWHVQSSSDTYTSFSFHGGGYINVRFDDKVSIQAEVLYNGLDIEFAGQELATSYLSMPLLFMFGILNNQLTVQAGPQLGVLLSADPESFRDSISDSEFSVNIGIEGKIQRFILTIRYAIGISNLASESLRENFPDANVKNNNLQVSIGYCLFCCKK